MNDRELLVHRELQWLRAEGRHPRRKAARRKARNYAAKRHRLYLEALQRLAAKESPK